MKARVEIFISKCRPTAWTIAVCSQQFIPVFSSQQFTHILNYINQVYREINGFVRISFKFFFSFIAENHVQSIICCIFNRNQMYIATNQQNHINKLHKNEIEKKKKTGCTFLMHLFNSHETFHTKQSYNCWTKIAPYEINAFFAH